MMVSTLHTWTAAMANRFCSSTALRPMPASNWGDDGLDIIPERARVPNHSPRQSRGHGHSTKSHEKEHYHPPLMAADAIALLDHLHIRRAPCHGLLDGCAHFSISRHRQIRTGVKSLVFGGLGDGMVEGVGDWDPIADALLAPDPEMITYARGAAFRKFADQTKSDRLALAACIQDVSRSGQPCGPAPVADAGTHLLWYKR